MKQLVCVVFLVLLCVASEVLAQQKQKEFTFETEFTYDDENGDAFSQYIFFNSAQKENGIGWNGYMRYFDVSKGPKHAEFVFGPTFDLNTVGELQTNLGPTTDGSLHVGATLVTSIGGKTIVFISDPKLYLNRRPSTLFQKVIAYDLFTIKGIPVTFRAEHLFIDWQYNIFLRIGPEVPILQSYVSRILGDDASLTVSPFYDIETNGIGSFLTLTVKR